ncbi:MULTISPECIES: alpha/beta fold hydrolase [unclassified Streptomyces]|uniref:alpha/beta fold hydrolase n=1 Tax=unclassified Streptomyces TaxID=2593676 RepID=UPI00110F7990|nr:alpha/beta hydrolase [Streptomyces sp. DASNCL29]TMU98378.1 alpha/beta hydrolase [Streptomyces sp. DASNCL29]
MATLTVRGGRQVRYRRAGSGPPVVLVAAGGPGDFWQAQQVPALAAAGYEAITLELPEAAGARDELTALLAESVELLGTGPCGLVGFSFGAQLVQELLVHRPDLWTRAVLVATRGRPDPVGGALLRAERALHVAGAQPPPPYQAFFQAVLHLGPGTWEREGEILDWLDLFEVGASAGGVPPEPPGDQTDQLAGLRGVTGPVLVLGFQYDIVAPPRLGREVAEALPAGRYREIPDCGHYGCLERPDTVNEAIVGFLSAPAPR